jgi:hypothetical protein
MNMLNDLLHPDTVMSIKEMNSDNDSHLNKIHHILGESPSVNKIRSYLVKLHYKLNKLIHKNKRNDYHL